MPMPANTARLHTTTVASTMSRACSTPALPTIHPDRRKTMTPNRWIMHVVKTPSQVPNSTGSDTKKLADHQGFALALRSWWKSSSPPGFPEARPLCPVASSEAPPSAPSLRRPKRAQSMSRPRFTVMVPPPLFRLLYEI
uniref:Uncharacterized protein n=1 Tax=Rhipicephalus zambeziensis TaxID=60191 RepID=A0A224YIG7_9ACAR